MRRLTASVFAVAGLVVVCGTAVAFGALDSTPVVRAPAGTAASAADSARAALGEVTLPAGSERLSAPPPGLQSALAEPDETSAYVTFRLARDYWTAPNAAAVSRLLARAPAGASRQFSWGVASSGSRGVQWDLPSRGRWLGPRWLEVGAITDPHTAGRWFVMVTAVAVWTPWRLELPSGVRSVTVRRLPSGPVLARVSDAVTVGRIIAAVDGLSVDDATRAVYACPEMPAGGSPGVELTFSDASGAAAATASTGSCPPDLLLAVPGFGHQQLMLGNLRAQLHTILGISLPSFV
jgi:hypothetical protein